MSKKLTIWLPTAVIALLLFAALPVTASAYTGIFDTFDSGTPGSAAEGWIGSGIISTDVSVSPGNSVKLQGSSGNAVGTYKTITAAPENAIVEADVYPGDEDAGSLSLMEASGKWQARVVFRYEQIFYSSIGHDDQQLHPLATYTSNAWYHVKIVHDHTNKTFDVYLDGSLIGDDIPMYTSGDPTPTKLQLSSGNDAGSRLIYFDNVRLYSAADTTAPELTGSSVWRSDGDTATVRFMPDKSGTCYYKITDSETPPSDIISGGTDGGAVTEDIVKTVSLNGLTEGTKYVHIVVKDGAGNVSAPLTISLPYDYYYFEDFEAYPLSTYIYSNAMSPLSQRNGGTGSENQKVVANVSDSSSNMLVLASNSGWASDQQIMLNSSTLASAGSYVFEGDVYPLLDTGFQLRFSFADNNYEGNHEAGVFFNGGKITTATKSGSVTLKDSYTAGEWHHVKVVATPSTSIYAVYVDGELLNGALPLPPGINRIAISAGNLISNTQAYYDNLEFYLTDDVPPPEDYVFDISEGPVTITDGIIPGTYKVTCGASETLDNIPPDQVITLTGNGSNNVTVSSTAGTVKILLDNVSISGTANSAFALTGSSKAELTLSGVNSLTSGNNRAGLEVPAGTELTIFGTDDDELTAQGGDYAAGIGGGYGSTPAQAGVITIKGGIIEATGGIAGGGTGSGAGIGGGRGGDGGYITIEGGTVTASGGYLAAGIGGGTYGTGGTILIKDGNVTATSGQYSAGIGGGYGRPMGSITIEGGTVNATGGNGGNGGAGIGGGYITSNITATHTGGSVLISGGNVTALGRGGSGIGSGGYQYLNQRLPVSVTITGGNVNASGISGAGIGSTHGTITITGGTITAEGSTNSAGIGGRYRESSGTINISGGNITAAGGTSEGGAGIGGGCTIDTDSLDGGTIEISGGTIIATGGEYGAGIGGGYKVGTGTIIITGGDITAEGGGGAGIGVGLDGSSGTIIISQAELSVSRNSPYTNHAIDAGTSGTIHIGFTGDSAAPSYDPEASRAQVTIDNDGISESGLVFGTCLIAGDGAGDLAGSYIEGVKQIVTYGIKAVDDRTFSPLTEGYGEDDRQIISVSIENAGNGTLSNLAVALSGDDSDSFTVTQPLTTELSNQGDATTFTLVPHMGLTAETYTAVVTISADNMSDAGFTVTQVVNEAVSTDKTLISVTTQAAITGVVSGTEKTASALGLPSAVTLITDDGSVQAGVDWNVDSCSYEPSVTTAQIFEIEGTVVLPDGVVNTNNISLDISISVTVNETATTDKTLISVTTPAAITGIVNKTEKTASALGLPSTVALVTDEGSVQASVVWDVESCSYEPAFTKAQTFTVHGTVTLPNGVVNPDNVSLNTSISVSVRARSSGGGNSGNVTSKPSAPEYKAVVDAGNGSDTILPVTVDKNSGSAAVDISTNDNLIYAGQTAVVTVPSVPGVDIYLLGVPVPSLKTPEEQSKILFRTDYGNVTVPSNMLTDITDISGKRAEISVGKGNKDNLPDDVKGAIGSKPIIRLTLTIDGRHTDWSNTDAPVTVSIPYAPTSAELDNPESIVVWYIDGSGNPQCITNGRYDSETGTVTFDTTHFSDYAVVYNKVSFNDVSSDSWYYRAVSFIGARKITNGTGGGNYSPEARLTRGEFIVLMMRTYGIYPDENPDDNFADAGDTYYTGYLAAAKRLGISAGVGNNMYVPGKEITRQEMFVLLYNALKVISQTPAGDSGKTLSDFDDAGQIDSWAQDAMTLLVKSGTVGGSGGNLNPTGSTTRAEMAQVLYNLLSK